MTMQDFLCEGTGHISPERPRLVIVGPWGVKAAQDPTVALVAGACLAYEFDLITVVTCSGEPKRARLLHAGLRACEASDHVPVLRASGCSDHPSLPYEGELDQDALTSELPSVGEFADVPAVVLPGGALAALELGLRPVAIAFDDSSAPGVCAEAAELDAREQLLKSDPRLQRIDSEDPRSELHTQVAWPSEFLALHAPERWGLRAAAPARWQGERPPRSVRARRAPVPERGNAHFGAVLAGLVWLLESVRSGRSRDPIADASNVLAELEYRP